MRVLIIAAGGLGNQIQMTAAIHTFKESLGWDIEILTGGAPFAAEQLRKSFAFPSHRANWHPGENEEEVKPFDGAVALTYGITHQIQENGWHGIPYINTLEKQLVTIHDSEVNISMNACREFDIAEKDLIWHGFLKNDTIFKEKFDIIIANNYYRGHLTKPNTLWDIKGYPDMPKLVEELKKKWPKYTICSIGVDDRDYVAGTVNRVGLPLSCTFTLLKEARFLISTDSMAFHAAACFDTPTYTLFTATNQIKCADPRFHATMKILGREDLKCRENCQRSTSWRKCSTWECQQISVEYIMSEIEKDFHAN